MHKKLVFGLLVALPVLLAYLFPIDSTTFDAHIYSEQPKTRYSIIRGEKNDYDNFEHNRCSDIALCSGGDITIRLYLL